MQLKEWLWANPNHFYIWQQITVFAPAMEH